MGVRLSVREQMCQTQEEERLQDCNQPKLIHTPLPLPPPAHAPLDVRPSKHAALPQCDFRKYTSSLAINLA